MASLAFLFATSEYFDLRAVQLLPLAHVLWFTDDNNNKEVQLPSLGWTTWSSSATLPLRHTC